MLSLSRVSCLVLVVAACGRSSSTHPDARQADSHELDAPAGDAAIDAPLGPTTRVWVYGDFLTNNVSQLGMFKHDAVTPPVTMTGFPSSGKLYDTNNPVPFAVSADGSKVAFAADSTMSGRFDLFLAAADGGSPVTVLTATNATSIAFSPDGMKLAFTADRDVAGQLDVYVVDAAANSTPVRVSPARNNAALDANLIAWSPDSKYLAMVGDFTTDGLFVLWTVDTTAATPAPVQIVPDADVQPTTTPKGVLSPGPRWTSNTKVVFYGALAAAGDRHIYVATADTAGYAELASTSLTRGDASKAEAHVFGISPDRSKIVFSADGETATAFDLYVANADGSGSATRLTTGTMPAGRDIYGFDEVTFSPDATKVALDADWGTVDNKYEPYVVALDGSGAHRVTVMPVGATDGERGSQKPQWTRNGARLYFIADAGANNNDFGVWVADPAVTDGTATLAVAVPTSGDVFGIVTRWDP